MKVVDLTPGGRPDLFYMAKGTGFWRDVVDPQTGSLVGSEEIVLYHTKIDSFRPVYNDHGAVVGSEQITVPNENEDITSNYVEGKTFRKRTLKGYGDVHFYNDRVKMFENGDLIATTQLQAEVLVAGSWHNHPFLFAEADIVKTGRKQIRAQWVGNVPGLPNQTYQSVFAWEVEWGHQDQKMTFYLKVPNRRVRLKWLILVPHGKEQDVSFNHWDYSRPIFSDDPDAKPLTVDHYQRPVTETTTTLPQGKLTTYTFEESGYLCSKSPPSSIDGLMIDPNLGPILTTQRIGVEMDGFVGGVGWDSLTWGYVKAWPNLTTFINTPGWYHTFGQLRHSINSIMCGHVYCPSSAQWTVMNDAGPERVVIETYFQLYDSLSVKHPNSRTAKHTTVFYWPDVIIMKLEEWHSAVGCSTSAAVACLTGGNYYYIDITSPAGANSNYIHGAIHGRGNSTETFVDFSVSTLFTTGSFDYCYFGDVHLPSAMYVLTWSGDGTPNIRFSGRASGHYSQDSGSKINSYFAAVAVQRIDSPLRATKRTVGQTWNQSNEYAPGDIVSHRTLWEVSCTTAIQWECTSSTVGTLPSATEPVSGSSWRGYWRACNLYNQADRVAFAAEVQDWLVNTPAVGKLMRAGTSESFNQGLVSIGSDGFNEDMCFHIIPDSGNIEFQWDRDRCHAHLAVHDFPWITGRIGSETNLLAGHFLFNDSGTDGKVFNQVGAVAVLVNSAKAESVTGSWSTLGVRGNALRVDSGYGIAINLSDYDRNTITRRGASVSRVYLNRPVDSYGFNPALVYVVGSITSIRPRYRPATDDWTLSMQTQGINNDVYVNSWGFNAKHEGKRWVWFDVWASWNVDDRFVGMSVDNIYNSNCMSFADPSVDSVYEISIGNGPLHDLTGGYTWDEVIILKDCVVPFGAFYTGYDQTGGYQFKHSSILFYANMDGQDTAPQIGYGALSYSTTLVNSTGVNGNAVVFTNTADCIFFQTSGNIDIQKGSVSMWIRPTDVFSVTAGYRYLFGSFTPFGAGTFCIGLDQAGLFYVSMVDTAGNWHGHSYRSTALIKKYYDCQRWFHVRMIWNSQHPVSPDGKHMGLWINGTFQATYTVHGCGYVGSFWNAPARTTFAIGNEAGSWSRAHKGMIDEVFITDDPFTPEIPTAYGKPLWAPIVRKV